MIELPVLWAFMSSSFINYSCKDFSAVQTSEFNGGKDKSGTGSYTHNGDWRKTSAEQYYRREGYHTTSDTVDSQYIYIYIF